MARYPNFPTFGVRPLDFERLLNSSNVTYRAIFKRADLCPCFDTARGSPEYTCPACGGIGRLWSTPALTQYDDALLRGGTRYPERASRALIEPGSATVTFTSASGLTLSFAVTLDANGSITWTAEEPPVGSTYRLAYRAPEQGRLHAQGITKQRDLADRGMIVAGQMDVSIPRYFEDLATLNPAWQAAEHDRFVFPDLKHRHQTRLTRGRNERLTYALTHEITSIRALTTGGTVTVYALGTDVLIDALGNVTWTDATALASGTPYVVDYIAAPEYYVWQELPQQRHIDGHDLPRRVSLRLFEQYPHRT